MSLIESIICIHPHLDYGDIIYCKYDPDNCKNLLKELIKYNTQQLSLLQVHVDGEE